jgi:hypothetical protein
LLTMATWMGYVSRFIEIFFLLRYITTAAGDRALDRGYAMKDPKAVVATRVPPVEPSLNKKPIRCFGSAGEPQDLTDNAEFMSWLIESTKRPSTATTYVRLTSYGQDALALKRNNAWLKAKKTKTAKGAAGGFAGIRFKLTCEYGIDTFGQNHSRVKISVM